MMAHCKNNHKNERAYGLYRGFPFLMSGRLDFVRSIARMGLPLPERSASVPLVPLVQQGRWFQRTLLEDHGLHLPLLLEW